MRVAHCIPIYGSPKADFVNSLIEFLMGSDAQRHALSSHRALGISNVQDAREAAAESALKADPDALLWTDIDQTFPNDVISRLAAHEMPIVGANYRRRSVIPMSSATKLVGETLIPITPCDAGLEEVDAIGFGVCLIRAEVFRKLPRPWFAGRNEDAYFCQQAKAEGFSVHVDHGLKVGHIAETVLTF